MSEQIPSLQIYPAGPERARVSLPKPPEGRMDIGAAGGMKPLHRYGDQNTPPRGVPFEKYDDHISSRVTALINCWVLRSVIHSGEAMYLEERVATHHTLQRYWRLEETGSRKEWHGEPALIACAWGRDAHGRTIGIGQVALTNVPEALTQGYAIYAEAATNYDAYTVWQPLKAPLGNEVMMFNPAANYAESTVENVQAMIADTGATRAYVI